MLKLQQFICLFLKITSTKHQPKSCLQRDYEPRLFGRKTIFKNQVGGSQMPAIGFCNKYFKPQVQPPGNKPGLQMILLHVCYSTLAQLTCLKKSKQAKENISFCTSGN